MKKSIVLTSLVSVTALAFWAAAAHAEPSRPERTQSNRTQQTSPRNPVQTERNRTAAPRQNGRGSRIVTTCTGVKSCNDFIALCAASGGDFTPKGSDGQGRPSSGECAN